VTGLTGVADVSTGELHTVARKTDGTVWAWGNNDAGQLGNNSSTSSTTPVQVNGLTAINAVSGGEFHNLALKNDGTLWSWGRNEWGQLGMTSSGNCSMNGQNYVCSLVPLQISALTGVVSIAAAGSGHNLAAKSNGTVWSWGENDSGELGNGSDTPHTTPAQISGLSGAVVLAAGASHSFAGMNASTATTNYVYDNLYRLKTVIGPSGTTGYDYDARGNRLTKTQAGAPTSYTYDRADRILTAGSTTYSVNPDGNLTVRDTDSFVYDQANRLVQATVGGVNSSFSYDGDGKRKAKAVGANTTNYVYDVGGGLPVVLDDGTRKYVWGASGLAFSVDKNPGAGLSVYHTDGLGSVRAITASNGDVVETYQTDEFGIPTLSQGTSTQPFDFAGEQRDAEDLLIYLRARVYDPTIGRFLQRDTAAGTLRAALSLNRYTYAQNNPTTYRDPSGHAISKLLESDCFTTASGIVSGYIVNATCLDFPLMTIAYVTVRPAGSPFAMVQEIVLAAQPPSGGGAGSSKDASQDEIPATIHGRERLIEAGFTYARYLATRAGEALKQADGASVYFKKVGRNAYDVIVEDAEGVVTAMRNKTRYELKRLAENHGWYYPGQVP